MPLEIDICSAGDADPAVLTQAIRDVQASGRVKVMAWADSAGNRHVRVDVAPPPEDRQPER